MTLTLQRVIRECFIKSGPVYIFIPLDLVDEHVPADLLKTPIDITPPKTAETETTSKTAADAIAQAISAAKNPVIFVDGLLMRHSAVNEARELIELLGFPVFQSSIGMGIIDSNSKQLVGTYNGAVSSPGISDAFDAGDLLLVFGRLPCDTNNGGFSQNIPADKTIEFKPSEVDVRGSNSYSGLYYKDFLPYLTKHLSSVKLPKVTMPSLPKYTLSDVGEGVTTAWFWPRLSDFFQEGDSIVVDTGTPLFGIQDCNLPSNTT